MKTSISPTKSAEALTELWSPRVIAELDDNYVKVAKVHGTLGWHSHENEDELFYILKGQLRIEMEDHTVTVSQGEMYIVPKGVRHSILTMISLKVLVHSLSNCVRCDCC